MFNLIIRTRDKYTPTIVNRKKNIKIHALKKSWDTKLSYECYSSFKKQRKLI